jgi:hypothetical protein
VHTWQSADFFILQKRVLTDFALYPREEQLRRCKEARKTVDRLQRGHHIIDLRVRRGRATSRTRCH